MIPTATSTPSPIPTSINNRHIKPKLIQRIVLLLKPAQALQPPRLIPVDGLERLVLVADDVIDVRSWFAVGLAGVPDIARVFGPLVRCVEEIGAVGDDCSEEPVGICVSICSEEKEEKRW